MHKKIKIFLLFFLFTPCVDAMMDNQAIGIALRDHFIVKAEQAMNEGNYNQALMLLALPVVISNETEEISTMRTKCEDQQGGAAVDSHDGTFEE